MGELLGKFLNDVSPEQETAGGPELFEGDYFSPDRTRQRWADERRVNREILNTRRGLYRYGHGDEVQRADREIERKSVLERMMDGLQAPNYAIAGGVRTLQEGGSAFDALRKGAAEIFASSDLFDFFDDDEIAEALGTDVSRESFADVLRGGKPGEDAATAALGLVMDIAFDPMTYASFGVFPFIKVANPLQKAAKAAAPFLNPYSAAFAGGKGLAKVDRFAAKTFPKKYGKSFVGRFHDDESKLSYITKIVGDVFNSRYNLKYGLKASGPEGSRALAKFLDILAPYDIEKTLGSREFQEGLQGVVQQNPEAFKFQQKSFLERTNFRGKPIVQPFTERVEQGVNVRDLTVGLASGMTVTERNLVGLFLGEPDLLKEFIKREMPDRADLLLPKIDAFQDYMGVIVREQTESGMYSKMDIRDYWGVPSSSERVTAKESKDLKDIAKKFKGGDPTRDVFEQLFKDNPGGLEAIDPHAMDRMMDVFGSLEKKVSDVTAGDVHPFNLDITTVSVNMAYKTLRDAASRRLSKGVLADPEMAQLIRTADDVSGMTSDEIFNNNVLRHLESTPDEVRNAFKGDNLGEYQKAIADMKETMEVNGLGVFRPVDYLDQNITSLRNLEEGNMFKDLKTNEVFTLKKALTEEGKNASVRQVGRKGFSSLDPDTKVWRAKKAEGGDSFVARSTHNRDLIPISRLKKGDKYVIRDAAGNDFVGTVMSPGKTRKVTATGAKGGPTTIDADIDVRSVVSGPKFLMHKEIVGDLHKIEKGLSSYKIDPGTSLGQLVKFNDKYMSLWKGYAVTSPGFLSRQLQSNMWANWLGGIPLNPKIYAQSMRLQAGRGDDIKLKLKVVDEHGDESFKVLQGNEIMYELDRAGVRGASGFERDIGLTHPDEEILNLSAIQAGAKGLPTLKALGRFPNNPVIDIINPAEDGANLMPRLASAYKKGVNGIKTNFGSGGKLLQWNRKIGGAIENNSKITHWMHRVKQGDTAEEAAMSAKKYLFDYGDLSDIERNILRRVIPFYTWVRKNVPLMYSEILRNPGRFGLTPKIFDGIEDLSNDSFNMNTPDYFQEVTALRMPKLVDRGVASANDFVARALYSMGIIDQKPEDLTGIQPVFLKPDLPFQDLDLPWNIKEVIAGFSPLIKAVPEAVMGGSGRGFSVFLDRPIERFEGEPADLTTVPNFFGAIPEGVMRKAPFTLEGSTQNLIQSTLPPVYGKIQRLRGKAQKGQLVAQGLSEFLGVRFIQNDINSARYSKGIKRRNKLRDLKKKLQKTGQYPQYTPRRSSINFGSLRSRQGGRGTREEGRV